MSLDGDAILDRRRLKRRLTIWRLAAIVAVFSLAFIALFLGDVITGYDHVAEISVTGLISDDDSRSEFVDFCGSERIGVVARGLFQRIAHVIVPGARDGQGFRAITFRSRQDARQYDRSLLKRNIQIEAVPPLGC